MIKVHNQLAGDDAVRANVDLLPTTASEESEQKRFLDLTIIGGNIT